MTKHLEHSVDQPSSLASQPPSPVSPPPLPPYTENNTDVLGILSIIAPFVGFSAVGLVLGLVGASKAKREGRPATLSRVGWIISLAFTVITVLAVALMIVISVVTYYRTASTRGDDSLPSSTVATNTRQVVNDGFSLTVPVDFQDIPAKDRNMDADYTQGDYAAGEFVLVFKENRSDFSSTMDVNGYADLINTNNYQEGGVVKNPIITPFEGAKNPYDYQIADYKMVGEVDKINIVYYIRYVATATSFYQIITWTSPSKTATTEPDLVKILESFREN